MMKCDCFNIMHSTQILSSISFNLTIPKSFSTMMQLNLVTITLPFLTDLVNFYEKKVCKKFNQVHMKKSFFLKSLTSLQFFFFIAVHFHYYFFFQLPHNCFFSLLFFYFDYHITIFFLLSLQTIFPNPNTQFVYFTLIFTT